MNTNYCPTCHSIIPANAPGGFCPACILRDLDEAPLSGRRAPSLAEVSAAFPQLEIIALIGQGGMGFVYQVRQPTLDLTVALPLWKEVPRFRRFKQRGVKVYHHCHTIDLALEVTNANCAPVLRKAIVANCRDLVDAQKFLGVEHHMFCLHLVDQATQRYLGMVCHFNQCPKGKPECQVSGCGKFQHVRILPWFKFKPERLNSHNSLVLFERAAK